jgi:deoxyribodipyrimidine photo-lyase
LTAFHKQHHPQISKPANRLDLEGTSRLSPYLRFGLISAREAFAQAHIAQLQAKTDAERGEIQTWLDELVWREFYTAILYHFPKVLARPFREDYEHIPWRQHLKTWRPGKTGKPAIPSWTPACASF